MAGYTRNDTSNNIASGNVINASDLDGEFDALVAAFDAATGHTHDGTAANGAPITKVGPAQDLVVSTGAITPKTDNTVDLGSSSYEFKDLYIDGTANIDSLVADTADINAGTIDGTTIGGSSAAAVTGTTVTASTQFTGPGTGITGLPLSTGVTGTLPIANGGTGASTADTALDGLGGTTVGKNVFKLTNPGAIRFLRINADNTVTALTDADFRTAIGAGTGDVTTTGTQTLTNKTLTDPAIIGTILEDVYTISDGAAFEIDPGNGSVQLITLGASRTPKATNFAAGESVMLMVDDGTAYTLTWTDSTFGGSGVVWKTDGGVAPTLNTTGYTAIVLWKVSTQVYGARVGDA